jgi:hypothetical protein
MESGEGFFPDMSLLPSFGNPFALFGLLGIGVLFYAYRKARNSKRREIPSLFFIKQLSLPKQVTRKKKLPLRFYLESLILTLLVLYIANPELPGRNRKVALVLDRSMSMGAVNSRGISRLEEAVSSLKEYLDKESADTRYVLYQLPYFLNDESRIVQDMQHLHSREEIKDKISSLSAVPFPDGLEHAVPEFSEHLVRARFNEIVIASDKTIFGAPHKSLRLVSLLSGSQENNLYLVSARTRTESTASIALDISYGFTGSGSTNVKFVVNEISPNEGILGESQSVIQSGSERIETIVLGSDLIKRNAIIRIEASISPLRDALSADNELYLVHAPSAIESSVLFISPDTKKDSKIKSSLEVALQTDIRHVSCAQAEKISEQSASGDLLYIYYKCPAPARLMGDTLVILPGRSSNLIPLREMRTGPEVTSWNSTHQITRYLKLSLLSVPNAIVLDDVSWGSSIISSSEGPLLLSGSQAGRKLIVSGIELLPFEGSRNKVGSILLLNILGALRSFSEERNEGSYTRDQFSELQQLTTAALDEHEKINILESGIYRGTFSDTGKKHVFSIQNFYQEESDTFSRVSHRFSEDSVVISEEIATSFTRYLLYAAIAVLFLDLLLVAVFRREL